MHSLVYWSQSFIFERFFLLVFFFGARHLMEGVCLDAGGRRRTLRLVGRLMREMGTDGCGNRVKRRMEMSDVYLWTRNGRGSDLFSASA